jgi:OOP family OmpA-OmpF porin
MLNNKRLVNTLSLAAPAALLLLLAGPAQAAETFADSKSGVPKNSYGECWQATGGVPNPECAGVMDSDGDGVTDDMDKCPGTPAGVKVDASGCPLDSDGDGVPDYKDKCPGTPAGAPVDANGCPLDSDGDGVPDYKDRCMDTPKGASVDQWGCPTKIVIDNVYFDFDKAVVKPMFKQVLSVVANELKSRPIDMVKIIGHTDSVGPAAYNQKLSERRAAAVMNFLANQGVPSAKMMAEGRGESEPLADNSTASGRERNRRVEFEVGK